MIIISNPVNVTMNNLPMILTFKCNGYTIMNALFRRCHHFKRQRARDNKVRMFLVFNINVNVLVTILPHDGYLRFSSNTTIHRRRAQFQLLLRQHRNSLLKFSRYPREVAIVSTRRGRHLRHPVHKHQPIMTFNRIRIKMNMSSEG